GAPLDTVTVVLGDTDATPFGLGAFASRQAVIGGGAAIRAGQALREKITRIAAHLLEAAREDLEVADGRVTVKGVPERAVSLAEVARVACLETHRLPADTEPGLEATRFYDPIRGTFAAGSQSAIVAVGPAIGTVAFRRPRSPMPRPTRSRRSGSSPTSCRSLPRASGIGAQAVGAVRLIFSHPSPAMLLGHVRRGRATELPDS